METISILIPTFNNETTIERCVLSAINQTYENVVVLVLNDGSTDNTLDILVKLSEQHSNLVIFNNENNIGRGAARNLLLDLSKTRFSCWLDADDYIHKDKIRIQYEHFMNNPDCCFLATPMKFFYNDGRVDETPHPEYEIIKNVNLDNITKRNEIPHPTVMFRTILARALRFNDNMTSEEDWDFYVRLYILGHKVDVIPNQLYFYNTKA
jgi:glycosyltransferase involved in cell wall biosynthesis